MGFVIRPAEVSDAAGIAALLNPIIAAGADTIMNRPITVADQEQYIRRLAAVGVYRVAAGEGRILGIQGVEPLASEPAGVFDHVGDISSFVAADRVRRGIGKALSAATFAAAKARGFRKLMAQIRGDNPRARAFYQALGFALIGVAREQARVGDAYVDEVLMERFL